ncbi:MAG: hypothetical protein F9K23_11795 [Bacteroidetes bacterium]|nr:MAG: hypothetical protein F9K23_11795 [Bacteroidota bacterium]
MRWHWLIVAFACTVYGCNTNKQPDKQGFDTIMGLLKTMYPQPPIDTISLTTNQTAFVYHNDSIVINHLFVPLFPEYESDDKGKNTAIVDTPIVSYKEKKWELPLSLQRARLQLEAVLFVPLSKNGFIVLVLTDPQETGAFAGKCTVVAIDTAETKDITVLQTDWLPGALYITDYNNDGVIELIDYKNNGFHGNGQYLNGYYTATLRSLNTLDGVEGQQPVNFFDSAQNNQTLFYLN